MKAVEVEVCDAIVASIDAMDLGEAKVVRRTWGDLSDDLGDTELRTLTIDISPWMSLPDLDAEQLLQYEQLWDVFVRKNLGQNEQQIGTGAIIRDEIDRLARISQDIFENFMPSNNAVLTTENGLIATYDPQTTRRIQMLDRKQLKNERRFLAWWRIGFNTSKAAE